MKKILFLFVAMICVLTANAQLNSNEKAFQNRVKTYLSNEGYRPEIDKDDDITFKKEGILYWISISEEDQGYFYVSFHRMAVDCEDANIYAVRKAANEVTRQYKIGKCYYNEANEECGLSIEGFYGTAADFNKYITRYLKILDNMKEELTDLYDEYSN